MKYVCDVCGWEYDEEAGYPDGGIAPGTKWEDLPDDFECPLCGVGKDQFSEAYQTAEKSSIEIKILRTALALQIVQPAVGSIFLK